MQSSIFTASSNLSTTRSLIPELAQASLQPHCNFLHLIKNGKPASRSDYGIPTYDLQTTSLKSIRSLAPLLDRILVQRVKAESKTASGIFLPESSVKELNEANVLAVGPGAVDKEGKRIPMSVGVGDKVLIPQV